LESLLEVTLEDFDSVKEYYESIDWEPNVKSLYISTKRSWKHLMEVAKTVPMAAQKTDKILALRAKLKNINCFATPEKLMLPYGPPTPDDMDDASNSINKLLITQYLLLYGLIIRLILPSPYGLFHKFTI
jgi:hypothetical protein